MPSENEFETPKVRPRWGARRLVALEFTRALGGLALLPLRALGQALHNERLRGELLLDLRSEAQLAPAHRDLTLPERPLRIFISCAEASGEEHAVRLVRSLRQAIEQRGAPAPQLVGLGGPALAAEGVRCLGDPVSDARMGFGGVLEALPFYMGLLCSAGEVFLGQAPDLYIGVDSPALHVPLGHMARRCGLKTVQYITPQYWAWAPWRVHGFRRAFDLGLSILPFEPAWFARYHVPALLVGHPQLDGLGERHAPPVEGQHEAPQLAILPGSRRSVIARNLPHMLSTLGAALGPAGNWSARVLQNTETHRELIQKLLRESGLPSERIEFSSQLQRGLESSTAALSVSGTILTHLMHERLPTVVLYRLESALQAWLGTRFLTVPYFSSVNLLAGSEVYPEFGYAGDEPPAAFSAAVERLLGDPDWRRTCSAQLGAAAERLGPAGASGRAALAILAQLCPSQAP